MPVNIVYQKPAFKPYVGFICKTVYINIKQIDMINKFRNILFMVNTITNV